eukprot:CAMPEP_0204108724 /NCGR_PEP_ID=MMETSP0361-20130328/874_1 /ASSEMBLY_ACC=CAM_ASM_000343 /TAXON_ID=268821 /ORGANISM="Scrippsiella Hangoei, Strain SHTV-5" /LENGTH=85 /DNA_ID=CAMNT_0051058373 /DNA_START=300 /DNA_END=554 /DNA_ORIENTATION=+
MALRRSLLAKALGLTLALAAAWVVVVLAAISLEVSFRRIPVELMVLYCARDATTARPRLAFKQIEARLMHCMCLLKCTVLFWEWP